MFLELGRKLFEKDRGRRHRNDLDIVFFSIKQLKKMAKF
jgi:hypothetical protein